LKTCIFVALQCIRRCSDIYRIVFLFSLIAVEAKFEVSAYSTFLTLALHFRFQTFFGLFCVARHPTTYSRSLNTVCMGLIRLL
jgi:hypothetical protein